MLPGLFVSLTAIGQSNLTPYKITVFQDATQIASKGIVRFHQQKADVPMELDVDAETVDLVTGTDFRVEWFRLREDTVVTKGTVGNWTDVLKANISRRVTIVYQIGQEFDEIDGDIRMVNDKEQMLLLHGTDDAEYFIPLAQVRQVVVNTLSTYRIDRKDTQKIMEIGINKDVPFVPMEMFSLHEGVRWEPICRIRIMGSDKAKLQMLAKVENNIADFRDIEVELSPGGIRSGGQLGGDVMDLGKLSMKKGEQIVVNYRETELQYKESHQCDIPWTGPQNSGQIQQFPVEHSLDFTVPVSASFSCEMHTVVDENNRTIANLELQACKDDGVSLALGQVRQVRVSVVETEKKRSKKPVKVGDKLYTRVSLEGKILAYNVGTKYIQLQLSRSLKGDLTDHGKARLAKGEDPEVKVLQWKLSLDKGQKKPVTYKYDALVPYQKPQ